VPLQIDVYDDALHVAWLVPPRTQDPSATHPWLRDMLAVLEKLFECPRDKIFVKLRQRQRGTSQYQRVDERSAKHIVNEGGLRFRVNLSDYLDTGLFLDHRITRAMVRERAAGCHVLNLFAYTGTFSVYAAAGGAAKITTVDLSNTYLDWARENFRLNQLALKPHRFVQADVLQWLAKPAAPRYDLVVLDPPTFSTSKRMQQRFDVQRDHPALINHVWRRLKPGGQLFFSTNFRGFKLRLEARSDASVDDISGQTIPEDFRRSQPHRCWLITRQR